MAIAMVSLFSVFMRHLQLRRPEMPVTGKRKSQSMLTSAPLAIDGWETKLATYNLQHILVHVSKSMLADADIRRVDSSTGSACHLSGNTCTSSG